MLRKSVLLLGALGAFAFAQSVLADTPCCVIGAAGIDAGQTAQAVGMAEYGGHRYIAWNDSSGQPMIATYDTAAHQYGKAMPLKGYGGTIAIAGNKNGLYAAFWVSNVESVAVMQVTLDGSGNPTGAMSGVSNASWQSGSPVGFVNIGGELYLFGAAASNNVWRPAFAPVSTLSGKAMKK